MRYQVLRKWGWLVAGWLALAATATAQPASRPTLADTLAPVSETLVRHYLARSLSVQSLNSLDAPVARRYALMRWAGAVGTRLAGRLGGWWSTPRSDAEARRHLDTLQRNIYLLRLGQPDMVAQGCIFEIVEPCVDSLTVPNRLRAEFGEDTVAQPRRRFRFASMVFPAYYEPEGQHYRWGPDPPGQAPAVPDLSRPEAQLWYYYCAAGQLDAGCEALHFGQLGWVSERDAGHRATWHLLRLVRRYARQRNRGFVLCDAHTHGLYYDPLPTAPQPDSVRQLLLDFHSSPLRPIEADTVRAGTHAAYLAPDFAPNEGAAIYQRSRGGRAPGGWLCARLPAQAEFDNGPTGVVDRPGQWPTVWGREEISWYANQPADYRSRWLIYAQARIRQLDPAVYFQPAGARGVSLTTYPGSTYWATEAGQAATIQAIWAGETTAEAERLLLIGPPAP